MLYQGKLNEQKPDNELPKQISILMIDDEASCLIGVEIHLIGSNIALETASSGKAGLAYLKTYPTVDLILLDMMMPDIYGLDVLKAIKKDPKLAHIPVILQTGTSNEADLNKAFQLGAVSLLKKPYDKIALLRELEKFLAI